MLKLPKDFRRRSQFPLGSISAAIAPLLLTTLGTAVGSYQGHGDFQMMIAAGYGILGFLIGSVVGIVYLVVAAERRERAWIATVLLLQVLGSILFFL